MNNNLKELWTNYWNDTEAVGTVEILLILVVLIAIVIIFRTRITALVNTIFDKINTSAQEIYG